ncbi:DNA-primase RepB domain-containing protein [Chelativorans sp. AA-79]|uniref:DUF3987 domain-containing protein n=1 Tax=Chelativorans sp. AA-79 TaxID=3028735 RepID=UPI0023F82E94|nr:DNA-primase RepB domain-containing protein [Chelativorans sp. AA-79]WEX07386.1 DNA-primase RepB domain-containing protein [Chelativorans sp. AA-79]
MSAAAPQPETSSSFDEAAIRSHVEILHQLAAGLSGKFVVSAFFANPIGEDRAGGVISHHRVGDVAGTVQAVMAHAETPNANVYICPSLMHPALERGKKGSEADVIAVLALVADMDDDTGRSGTMPAEPNYVIESSPGNHQCFLLLDRPLSPQEAKPLASGLKRAANCDHCTADVSHVWRVPGTLNWPNAKKISRGRPVDPATVGVAAEWDGTVTSVDDLRAALAPHMHAAAEARSFQLGELPSIDGIEVSAHAAEMLAADDVGYRSEHAAKVVEQLAYDGLTAEQAFVVFMSATGNWFLRYTTEDRARTDFLRCWGKYGAPHVEYRERGAAVIKGLLSKARPTAANDNDLDAPARKVPTPPTMHPDPFNPDAAGGLLRDISRWITETAIIPVPELSLTAAIALIGGMFGDKALGPTRSGLNVFMATVMGVASGKGHAPKSIIHLANAAGRPGAVTNGDPTSFAAIERMLRRNASTVVVMDEFGLLLQDVNSKRANSASASIRKLLLAIYDQADAVFHGRQYASADAKPDDSPIMGPALTVLGMTTPTTLYAGLSEDSLSDGMLSRFVFIEGQGPEEIRPPRLNREVRIPRQLQVDLQRAVGEFPKGDNPLGINKVVIPFDGGEYGKAYNLWADIFRWQSNRGWNEREYNVNGRAAENTIRLASIRAVSRNPADPAITADDVSWGWGIVHRSIQIVTEGVDRHMSGSTVEALRKAVVRALEKSNDRTLPWSFLLQREGVSAARQDEVAEALSWLIDTGKVKELTGKAKPGPRCRFQLVA